MTNQLGALAKALIAAKSEMEPLVAAQTAKVQTKSGGSYSYSFAELADVYRVCESVLGKHGIALFQNVWTSTETNIATAETILYHADSDQSFIGGHIEMPARGTPQEVGSAITYARRYSLVATVGLATQDDDGNAASSNNAEIQRRQSTTQPQQPQKQPHRQNGNGKQPVKQQPQPERTIETARSAFHAAGNELFGKEWEAVRSGVVKTYSAEKSPNNVRTSSNDLATDELDALSESFRKSGGWWKKWLQENMATKETAEA